MSKDPHGGGSKGTPVVMVLMGVVIGLGIALLFGGNSVLTGAAGLSLILAGVGGVLIACGLRRHYAGRTDLTSKQVPIGLVILALMVLFTLAILFGWVSCNTEVPPAVEPPVQISTPNLGGASES